jgi:hypothetical protein
LPGTDEEKRDINKRNERNRHQNKKLTAKNYPKIKKRKKKEPIGTQKIEVLRMKNFGL